MQLKNKIVKCLLSYSEFITIPTALLIWYASPYVLRWVDPSAGTYDSGVFQIIIFTVIQFLFYNAVAWLVFKLTFPKMYKMLDEEIENRILNNGAITTFEKIKVVLWIFSLYLVCIVLLSRVISPA